MDLSAIIIEDEEECSNALKNLLEHFCTGIRVVATVDRISKAVNAIHLHQPQLVFLDIELPNEDGFSLFNYISNPSFQLIFTTAYDRYAAKAFRLSALDYLLKPIDLEELRAAIALARERNILDETKRKLNILKENLNSFHKKLVLPTPDGFSFIDIKNIIYCEAVGNYTAFHLLNKQKLLVSKTLKIYTELLEEFSFFRISRGHLVNINYIEKYSRQKSPSITLQNGISLAVSTTRRERLFERITSLL